MEPRIYFRTGVPALPSPNIADDAVKLIPRLVFYGYALLRRAPWASIERPPRIAQRRGLLCMTVLILASGRGRGNAVTVPRRQKCFHRSPLTWGEHPAWGSYLSLSNAFPSGGGPLAPPEGIGKPIFGNYYH